MEIKKNLLIKYLELLALKGDIENREALIDISTNTIESVIGHSSKTLVVYGKLKGEFDDIGKIGIDNIPLLLTLLKSFPTHELTLKKDKNKLVLTSSDKKLKVSIMLREPDYIVNTLENKKMDDLLEKSQGNAFILFLPVVKLIYSYINALGCDKLVLKGDKKELKLLLENKENEIVASFDLEQEVKPFEVKLMRQITAILNVVNTDIEISIKNDSPISLKVKDEDMEITYIIAPIKKD